MNTTFKTLKKHALSAACLAAGMNGATPVCYSFASAFPRYSSLAHEYLGKRSPTGYFNDEDQFTGVTRGVVVSFPARPSFPNGWHIAATESTDTGHFTYFLEVFDSAEDAARDADHHAEGEAEINREYEARWQAANALNDKIETYTARLRECLALRHRACMAYVIKEAHHLCKKIRAARAELSTDFEGVL